MGLAALPKQIEKMELQQSELLNRVSEPEFYQQSADKVSSIQEQLAQLTTDLESAYDRWQQLEAKQENN